MPTVELKSQIQFLISLQTVDSEIYSLDKQRQAMPEEIKAIDAAFQEKRLKCTSHHIRLSYYLIYHQKIFYFCVKVEKKKKTLEVNL